VAQDKAEAVKWDRLAAEQGYAEAQYNLGLAYYRGEWVMEDKAEAVKWIRLAAEQKHDEAWKWLVKHT
jgi:TPR repeat protein